MNKSSLDVFIKEISDIWGPLSSELVLKSKELIQKLISESEGEEWLLKILEESREIKTLYKDPKHGFLLLAQFEGQGLYRVPHNHGSGWVIYGVHSGEMEMGSFTQIVRPNGDLDLIKKESYSISSGSCKAYLPGDIHDTRCISAKTLMFRLTSTDFKEEFKSGRMIKYINYEEK
ncbi:MAG: hypothetical protein VXV96_15040 [Bdellovibrionota bacterium]|nr:hypothetical protein [Bdellovibrionota bacterium]